MNSIKFYTLGCKVNQYETQEMRERVLGCGFKEIYDAKKADIYIINTCTVTHKADAESLVLLRRVRRENPRAKIIVTGCLTELDQDKIRKINKHCLIVRNRDKENILSLLNQRTYEPANLRTTKGISYFAGHTRAFLKIQDGCDNFCSYCKVPLVRGGSRSKPLNDIIKEAEWLVENGYKEIVLTGICLGSYRADSAVIARSRRDSFDCHCEEGEARRSNLKKTGSEQAAQSQINIVDVISTLEKINGLLRIRLSSIEPRDIREELIEKIALSGKLCRHLHIPLQSGDDAILKKMNRKYTTAEYLELIQRIKKRIPGIAVTTDVMVGFPGENEESFNNTKELVKKIMPLKVHIFSYSARKGVAAANFNQQLAPAVIKRRASELAAVADACSLSYRGQFLDRVMAVLIEEQAKEGQGFWEGYTDNYMKVLFRSGSDLRNQLVPLRLTGVSKGRLLGQAQKTIDFVSAAC